MGVFGGVIMEGGGERGEGLVSEYKSLHKRDR